MKVTRNIFDGSGREFIRCDLTLYLDVERDKGFASAGGTCAGFREDGR